MNVKALKPHGGNAKLRKELKRIQGLIDKNRLVEARQLLSSGLSRAGRIENVDASKGCKPRGHAAQTGEAHTELFPQQHQRGGQLARHRLIRTRMIATEHPCQYDF